MLNALSSESPPPVPADPITPEIALASLGRWIRTRPIEAALLLASLSCLVYFFGFFKIYTNGLYSTAVWAWIAWNPTNNQEHAVAILPISLFLAWYHRDKIAAAQKIPSNRGLGIVIAGILCFLVAARTLQPRLAIIAFPLLVFGGVWFLWGKQVARAVLFPCAFMLFMVPIGGFVQGTVSLQILVSTVCNFLSSIIGIKIEAAGTSIRSLDGSFNFEIAEGCSGIRSLMAMTTLTALYAHFTQRELWKKLTLFASSIVFAIIGNIVRIFTVILVAKFLSPTLASGLYHDYSAFVFFPAAVAVMVSFGNLLNRDWKSWLTATTSPGLETKEGGGKGPITYDY